jgi:hypothetical protein
MRRKTTSTGRRASRGLRPGLPVVGADGQPVGRVKEVAGQSFLLTRRWALDRWLPTTCVQRVREGQVVLTVAASQINNLGWTSMDAVAAATTQLSSTGM